MGTTFAVSGMKVLVPALTAAPGGSINVLVAFLRDWPTDDEILCLTWRPAMARALRETGHQVVEVEASSTPTALWQTMISHRRQIARWEPEVVFSQQYILPGVSAPQVVHHRNLVRFEPVRSPSLKARARDASVARTLRRSAISLFNSHTLRDAAFARWPHLAQRRTAVVHNPVDVRDFEHATCSRDLRTVRILVPQSDMPHKRNDVAVQVLHRLCRRLEEQGDYRRIEMTFVGTGNFAQVCAVADRLDLADQVRLPGYLTRPSLAAIYAESDVVLITSGKESFCNPVLEAHAAGIPIVTTPLLVFREIWGPLSMTAADDGAEALTEKLIEALEHSPPSIDLKLSAKRYAQAFNGSVKAAELRELLIEAANAK